MNKLKMIKALTTYREIQWYKMEVTADVADIYIYDEISLWGITADQFVKDLNAIKSKTIRLHLNTPGGSVFDGIAIFNALKQHPANVETYIEGLAASIGSLIALAGDKVYMADNSFFMIHEPWILAMGDAAELRKTADLLDKISGTLIKNYMQASEQKEEQVKKWLADETWFTAAEAKAAGFIDEITEEIKANASHDLSVFNNVPEKLVAQAVKEIKKEVVVPVAKQIIAARESMRMRLELETVN
jgi:ATP-dependent Clp protease, protease subunit